MCWVIKQVVHKWKGLNVALQCQPACVCVQQAGAGGWSSLGGGGGWRREAASLLILYLSSMSTESSAVPPSSPKPKYYYLCPLHIITPPLRITTSLYSTALIIIICLQLGPNTTPCSHELRPDPVAFMTSMILPQNSSAQYAWQQELLLK